MAKYNGKELSMVPVSTEHDLMLEWVRLEPGDGTRYEFGWGGCPGKVLAGVANGGDYVMVVTKWGFWPMHREGLMGMADDVDGPEVGYFMEHLAGARGKDRTCRYSLYVILSYVRKALIRRSTFRRSPEATGETTG